MTVTLNMPPEMQERLAEEARRRGLSVAELALQILESQIRPKNRREAATAILEAWMKEEDAAEQVETGEYLVKALDEDRLSDRRLFPRELKGITW